jgi:hypothetical protein
VQVLIDGARSLALGSDFVVTCEADTIYIKLNAASVRFSLFYLVILQTLIGSRASVNIASRSDGESVANWEFRISASLCPSAMFIDTNSFRISFVFMTESFLFQGNPIPIRFKLLSLILIRNLCHGLRTSACKQLSSFTVLWDHLPGLWQRMRMMRLSLLTLLCLRFIGARVVLLTFIGSNGYRIRRGILDCTKTHS